jgi:hypothetical protein
MWAAALTGSFEVEYHHKGPGAASDRNQIFSPRRDEETKRTKGKSWRSFEHSLVSSSAPFTPLHVATNVFPFLIFFFVPFVVRIIACGQRLLPYARAPETEKPS